MIIKNTLLLTISHILSRGGLILSSIVISSLMDEANFLIYSYFILTSTTISIYSALGIGITTSKLYTELNKSVNNTDSPIIIMCIDIYASNALIGLEKYMSLCVSSFVFLISTMIVIYLSIKNNNIYYAIIGLIISAALQLILHSLFLFLYLSKMHYLSKIKVKLAHLKEIAKTMGPMMFVSLFAASTTWIIGQYILSSQDNATIEFNLFSIGLQWFSLAVFIPTVFSRVLLN